MKLYNYWRSSCSYRVRIALAYKNIAYEYAAISLVAKPGDARGQNLGVEYAQLNPLAEVPTLEIEDGGARRRVSQSLAILELLEETHPAPPLLPREVFWRAKARQYAEMINAGIQPHQNLATTNHFDALHGGGGKQWARHFITRGLTALEEAARSTHGLCLIADEVSMADVCLVPQLYSARRFDIDLAPFRTLTRVEAHLLRMPAFIAAHPDRQPDAITK